MQVEMNIHSKVVNSQLNKFGVGQVPKNIMETSNWIRWPKLRRGRRVGGPNVCGHVNPDQHSFDDSLD